MPRAGFEHGISTFERPKTVLALERAAIETGYKYNTAYKYYVRSVKIYCKKIGAS
jgi:hypothetical protein